MQLEPFNEIHYVPAENKSGNISAVINQQVLTTVLDFVSVEYFAMSVSNIIESICEDLTLYPSKY